MTRNTNHFKVPPTEPIGTLRYPGRGGRENVALLEKAWSEDAANLVGKTN